MNNPDFIVKEIGDLKVYGIFIKKKVFFKSQYRILKDQTSNEVKIFFKIEDAINFIGNNFGANLQSFRINDKRILFFRKKIKRG